MDWAKKKKKSTLYGDYAISVFFPSSRFSISDVANASLRFADFLASDVADVYFYLGLPIEFCRFLKCRRDLDQLIKLEKERKVEFTVLIHLTRRKVGRSVGRVTRLVW